MAKNRGQILKGFRDFLPPEAIKRGYVVERLREVFEVYGYDPLETPAMEYAEVLEGKYGEEEKLIYKFRDMGERWIGLRFDQTVPLARVVGQYEDKLPMPFKRYQIQPVWRAEKPQAGRFREILQCDIDIVGVDSYLAELDVLLCINASLEALSFTNFVVEINDRQAFADLPKEAVRALDKVERKGKEGVLRDLAQVLGSGSRAEEVWEMVKTARPTETVKQVMDGLKACGVEMNRFKFNPFLARGLDYYTGMVFEAKVEGYGGGSVGGGGRYDNLIGRFSGKNVPAVGFAFGIDRLIEVMEQQKQFGDMATATEVLVAVFSPEEQDEAMALAEDLRRVGLNTEMYLEPGAKLDKQLKFADKKGIPYVAIIGPEEKAAGQVTVKNMISGKQTSFAQKKLMEMVKEGKFPV